MSTRSQLYELDERLQPVALWLFDLALDWNVDPVVTSVRRSWLKQGYLYLLNQGEQTCRPGHSSHELGLAWDWVLAGNKYSGAQAFFGQLWSRMGGWWGGSKDPVHFSVVEGCI